MFVGCTLNPTFCFGRSLPFLVLSIINENKKILCIRSFNNFAFTIHVGSNCYIHPGVRDLKVTL